MTSAMSTMPVKLKTANWRERLKFLFMGPGPWVSRRLRPAPVQGEGTGAARRHLDKYLFGIIIPKMTDSLQQVLARALLALLKPLVRILLRNGMACGSFSELAKKAYVDVAFEDFVPTGRKASISHVSALTGLTRKETKRLHELDPHTTDTSEQRYNRTVRVISGWMNDPEFAGPDGSPRPLPIESDGAEPSFARLVKRYSGDITTRAMLTVLESASCVEHSEDGVRLLTHAYLPGNDPHDLLAILGKDTGELVATIDHNLVAAKRRRRFQRKVSNHRVDAAAVEAFRALSAKKAQRLLEELDAWLARHEVNDIDSEGPGYYVSLGIYYYEQGPRTEDTP